MNVWIIVGVKKIYNMLVSPCDQYLFNNYSLVAMPKPNGNMRVRCTRKVGDKLVRVYAHRLIMKPSKNEFIDHINHNQLDNTRENLRVVNPKQNNLNKRIGGIENVFKKNDDTYVYKIRTNGKRYQSCGYETIKSCFLDMLEKQKELLGKDFKYYHHFDPEKITGKEEVRLLTRKIKHIKISINGYYQAESSGSSKYKGVRKRGSKFLSEINHNSKSIYLGSFISEIEAAKAHDKAALKIKGIGCELNFPNNHTRSSNPNSSLS